MSCAYKINYGEMCQVLNKSAERLVGEALTIVEAAVSDDTQREATKRLLKQAIWKYHRTMLEYLEKGLENTGIMEDKKE